MGEWEKKQTFLMEIPKNRTIILFFVGFRFNFQPKCRIRQNENSNGKNSNEKELLQIKIGIEKLRARQVEKETFRLDDD